MARETDKWNAFTWLLDIWSLFGYSMITIRICHDNFRSRGSLDVEIPSHGVLMVSRRRHTFAPCARLVRQTASTQSILGGFASPLTTEITPVATSAYPNILLKVPKGCGRLAKLVP
jgi:hypothetical protein